MQTGMDLAKTVVTDRYKKGRAMRGKFAYLMNAREEGLYRESREGFGENTVLLF